MVNHYFLQVDPMKKYHSLVHQKRHIFLSEPMRLDN
nr:MAG TPA: hypothetical protein [Caudoviricetes sp.]